MRVDVERNDKKKRSFIPNTFSYHYDPDANASAVRRGNENFALADRTSS